MALLTGDNLRPEKVRQWPLQARREKKRDIGYVSMPSNFMPTSIRRETGNGNIAAIDFGTTYCSVAYTTEAGDGINTIQLNNYHPRVPTAILLKKKELVNDPSTGLSIGVQCKIDSFGYEAQQKYQKLKTNERSNYIYFERMKMRLQHDKSVDRNMKIRSDNTAESDWYLIEVIAYIIRYLKDTLMDHLSRNGSSISVASHFDWVITVPAIWQARGKAMMREAGYLAGLCGSSSGIHYLSFGSSSVQCPKEVVPSKLSLVPEPEAAALYCQSMKHQNLAEFCKGQTLEESFKAQEYIVVDIGGGTVDITAQEVTHNDGEINVVLAPRGNDSGGMKVNREFVKFLQKILGERMTDYAIDLETAFPNLLSGADSSILKPCLNNLIYNDFETQKESFGRKCSREPGSESNEEIAVKIPDKISTKCGFDRIKANIDSLNDPRIELDEDCIYMKYSKVKELFQPAIDGILDCTQRALFDLARTRQGSSGISTIYLVGGFGGCKYVYDHIKHLITTEFPETQFSLIVPGDHKLAVAHGAVQYKKSPVIHSRCLNRTYGIAVSVDYDPKVHRKEYFKYNEDGDKVCSDAFLTFLQSGEAVSADEVAVDEILPNIDVDRVVRIPFYSSEEPSLDYIVNRPSPGVVQPLADKVGELLFEISDDDILHKDQRRFQVMLDFSSAEICATVRYLNTDTDIQTTLDFLS